MESAGLSQSAAFSLYLPRRAGGKATYLLYLDESGNPEDPEDRHFVIGGLAVFERVTFWLNKAVDDVQAKHFPGRPPIEFHASHIRAGKGFWRGVEEPVRDAVLQDLACGISAANDSARSTSSWRCCGRTRLRRPDTHRLRRGRLRLRRPDTSRLRRGKAG